MNDSLSPPEHADVIVIGAGMAGLRAAGLLAAAGHHVIVVDKGRRHGGRMATRRVDEATFDTGAIAFLARSGRFRADLAEWAAEGHVRSTPSHTATHASGSEAETWRGAPMMRSLPSALASAIDGGTGSNGVRLATQVTSIASGPSGWRVTTLNEGSTGILSADTLVLTAPAPQALALLDNGRAMVSSTTMSQLADVVYAPSLTVLARPADRTLGGDALASRPTVGPGTAAPDLERVHRNESTGASAVVAVTIQASAAFSAAHLDGDRDTAAATAATQASTALGVPLEVVHIHGWRYAQVITGIDVGVDPPALLDASSGSPLVLAGDHFGPSVLAGSVEASLGGVERAYLSGTAAAGLLL